MAELKNDFPHNYSVEINPELPGDGQWRRPEIFFPKDFKPSATDSYLTLRIKANDKEWIGHFKGDITDTGAWSTPDPDTMLVVAWDEGYYFKPSDPDNAQRLPISVRTVTPVPTLQLILINDYTRVMALDASGIRWHAPPLVMDDLRINAIEGDKITCIGDAIEGIEEKDATIVLNAQDGSIISDSSATESSSIPKSGWRS